MREGAIFSVFSHFNQFSMTALELKVGRTYRAKKPAPSDASRAALVNDRTVIWVGEFDVQYDGPAVAIGRKLPRVSKEAFLKWADRDVTDELPEDSYALWPPTRRRSESAS